MEKLIKSLLAISDDIRYVAIYQQGELTTAIRPGIASTSSAESDKYEELIVNPTLLTLVTQRGNIDCGGVDFVLVRYGNFFQIIIPRTNGHLSISAEPSGDPLKLIESIRRNLNIYEASH